MMSIKKKKKQGNRSFSNGKGSRDGGRGREEGKRE